MAIIVYELQKSRPRSISTDDASVDLIFVVGGTTDDGAAYA